MSNFNRTLVQNKTQGNRCRRFDYNLVFDVFDDMKDLKIAGVGIPSNGFSVTPCNTSLLGVHVRVALQRVGSSTFSSSVCSARRQETDLTRKGLS